MTVIDSKNVPTGPAKSFGKKTNPNKVGKTSKLPTNPGEKKIVIGK